ncbi:MAG TPA: hypothetical protein PKA66_07550 [Gemmatimonadales bacterium]|nr:hypothetical protein [Gemmatimonadales bacterium]
MHAKLRLAALVLLAAAAGCADREPSAPGDSPAAASGTDANPPGPNSSPEAMRLEREARQLALALAEPGLREYLSAQLRQSPIVEHKLQFQRLLERDARRIASAMAGVEGLAQAAVMQEASATIASELYFPVPGHLERWDGGPDLLVATALNDHDVPVAFTTRGERVLLDPQTPPPTPVLALVPQETDFDRPPARMNSLCQLTDCTGTGRGGGSGGSPPAPALYLTRAQFVDTFEGWLKGNPEFELHVLGPAAPGDTSSMVSYQCVGEHAPTGYYWDMNAKSWSGSAKVFAQAQMDALEQSYPGRSYLVMALEDDDGACDIKMGQDRVADLFTALKNAYQSYIGVKDVKVVSINGVTRIIVAAKSGARLISSLASIIKTNDDLIGIAVADSVIGRTSSVGQWAVLEGNSKVNGWLNLEMK